MAASRRETGVVSKSPCRSGTQRKHEEDAMSDFMKSLSRIAIPVTLQSMLQASFSIIDQIMIGQLGEVNIAAVGLYGNFSLIFSVVIGSVGTVAGNHDH